MNGATREIPGVSRLPGSLDVDFSIIDGQTAVAGISARPDGRLDASAVAVRRRGLYERAVKPTFDGFVALICFIVLLPVLLVVALVVRIALGRGIIYRQPRVGRGGRPFTIYKFRTMLPDRRDPARQGLPWYGEERRVSHKREDDPRHTPTGRFLRKWSLDELPQLFNVLKGDMGLVGPRPELVSVVERYEPWQHRRHDVKPGLTGLWQVSERGTVEMHHATPIDLEYVDQLSPLTDLKIMARTIPVLLARHTGS